LIIKNFAAKLRELFKVRTNLICIIDSTRSKLRGIIDP
jgi:hypothetical protein